CLSFHPNSLYLATGSSDRTCRLWDVQKGHCVRVFIGHRAAVQVVKVSPDGRYLASAGDDGLILLWSLATGQRVKTFWGHAGAGAGVIQSLTWSCESTVLVSGGSDETVRVWDVVTPPSTADGGDGGSSRGPLGLGSGATTMGGGGGGGGGPGTDAATAGTGGGPGAGGVKGRLAILPRPGAGSQGSQGKGGKDGDRRGDKGLGLVPRAQPGEGPCPDLLATLATKRTPVVEVKFTPRNLCLAAGPMRESE
ncbi:hypothetical protein JCM3774_004139, partial [Rhodotorula dairenensis]